VNNAGVMIFGEFEWQLPSQALTQLEVNVLGTMSVTRQLMPTMRRHSSRIVNVTSHCAFAPLPGLAVYGATKAALEAWSTSLRLEVNKYGVSVVSFVPGLSLRTKSALSGRLNERYNRTYRVRCGPHTYETILFDELKAPYQVFHQCFIIQIISSIMSVLEVPSSLYLVLALYS
jgi:short-subunit dehydrogenase